MYNYQRKQIEMKVMKQHLLFIVLCSILIAWCLPKFVELSVINTVLISVLTPSTSILVSEVIKMFKNFIENMKKRSEKRKRGQIYLRSRLDTIIRHSLNIDGQQHPSSCLADIKLMSRPDLEFSSNIERKVAKYNEKAEFLIKLSYGCERLVRDTVTKNVLKRLYDIDRKITFQWIPGVSASENKLSGFLSDWLTKEILLGRAIDKGVIDSFSSVFFKKIDDLDSSEEFALFLKDLNEEIEFQRKYGCLNLFTCIYEEVKKLAEDLRSDVDIQK